MFGLLLVYVPKYKFIQISIFHKRIKKFGKQIFKKYAFQSFQKLYLHCFHENLLYLYEMYVC